MKEACLAVTNSKGKKSMSVVVGFFFFFLYPCSAVRRVQVGVLYISLTEAGGKGADGECTKAWLRGVPGDLSWVRRKVRA